MTTATTTAEERSRTAKPSAAGASTSIDLDYRPSYWSAAVASALVLALYIITLGPSTAMWDTSEYIAAAYVVGLPHPPGNPFFVLLGRVFTLLPIAPSVAARVNILAAVCSAVSAGLWFLITERVLVSWLPHRWQRIVGGSLAALLSATAFTVWSQSVVNEKVYTVALVGVALIAWLTVRWCDDPDGAKADRLLVLLAYVLGLGYANHMAGMLAAPAVGLAVVIRRPQTLLRWKLLLAIAGAVVLGMTPFATQPIRAAYFPAINEGEPTGCRTTIAVDCTLSTKTWDAFMYNFNREQYGKPELTQRQAPFTAQVGMWWLYFKWQWLRDPYQEHATLQAILAALFLVLGLFGGWVHWRRDRQSFWFFGPLMFIMTLLLIFYLNFKYGYSQAPELAETVDREVRDRDYFYLWSFSAWSVWAALGVVFVWEAIAALVGSESVKFAKQVVSVPTKRSWLVASPVLALCCLPFVGNWGASTRRGDTTTRDFAHDLLNSLEPYAIVVTVGDNDTFPLWYAQEVEGVRRDVVVANTSLLNTDWYVRQLIRNPVRPFERGKAPAVYHEGTWPQPTKPVLALTFDEADSIPLVTQLPDTVVFQQGAIEAKIPPRYLERADILVLRMIRDNPERPIYFARTSGGYGHSLGLGPYLITQGLARKLSRTPINPGRDTILVRGEGFVDVARTATLWNETFQAPASIIAKDGWPDQASASIPILYVQMGFVLYDVFNSLGRGDEANKTLARTEAMARSTRVDKMFGLAPLEASTPMGDTAPKLPVKK
jgi:hypothetical protein